MKTIHVNIAGREMIADVDIEPSTTAAEVLASVDCGSGFTLTPGVGLPAFAPTEEIYERVKANQKLVALPEAKAGAAA